MLHQKLERKVRERSDNRGEEQILLEKLLGYLESAGISSNWSFSDSSPK